MATRNIFELDPRPRPLAAVVILGVEPDRVVWRALPVNAGWVHVHACGRKVHQWAGAQRPSHARCPGCQKWVQAP